MTREERRRLEELRKMLAVYKEETALDLGPFERGRRSAFLNVWRELEWRLPPRKRRRSS